MRATRLHRLIALVLAAAAVASCRGVSANTPAVPPPAQIRMANLVAGLRGNPPALAALLRRMPKGGDLHNHLGGAIYAESYITWAVEAGLCVTPAMGLVPPPCDVQGRRPAQAAQFDTTFRRQLIDAWSMRNVALSGQSGHDHFFDSFAKFGPAGAGRLGDMLAEVASRAADGGVSYLELMLSPDDGAASALGQQVGWSGDATATRAQLEARGAAQVVAQTVDRLRAAEAKRDALLSCGTAQAQPGCRVTVRYIAQVIRTGSLGGVFAQMVVGLALASRPDSKVVAINLVAPEDDLPAMRNFSVHMQMLRSLRPLYPAARVTLHAGELAPGLVPPDGLRSHIRESVEIAGAARIGHGVDVMHETDAEGLLREMAARRILVEICLTSNDGILGIRGTAHPLASYLAAGVPVALATDDEGVSRSEMSMEFLRAVLEQGLGYLDLKTVARNSLEYAFVDGASLWRDARGWQRAEPCADASPDREAPAACATWLAANEKARLQWDLERRLSSFETSVPAPRP